VAVKSRGDGHAALANAVIGLVRGAFVKRRMRTPLIVEVQIAINRGRRLAYTVVGLQINLLVLDRSPQPLDKHVVTPDADLRPDS